MLETLVLLFAVPFWNFVQCFKGICAPLFFPFG